MPCRRNGGTRARDASGRSWGSSWPSAGKQGYAGTAGAAMSMTNYSYRNGLREAVAFLLLDRKGHVLLECRPDERGGFSDVFYPSGSIEMKDYADGRDYRETAL